MSKAESQLTHIPFMKIDNKIISAVILSLPLIQEGQLSVTGKSMCTNIVAGLGGSVGCVVRLETRRSRVQPPPRLATFFCGD